MDEIILFCKGFIGGIRENNSWCGELVYVLGLIFYLFVILLIVMTFVDVGKVILTLECGLFVYMIYDCIDMERINKDIVIFGVILLIAIFVMLIMLSIHEDYYGCGLVATFFDCLIGGIVDIAIVLMLGVCFIFPFGIFICGKHDRY